MWAFIPRAIFRYLGSKELYREYSMERGDGGHINHPRCSVSPTSSQILKHNNLTQEPIQSVKLDSPDTLIVSIIALQA